MALAAEKLQESLRKLRKSLKDISKRPSPKQIHNLRTRSRRVEAVVHALMLDKDGDGKRLIEALKPIRKETGKVRDMDVFVKFISALASNGEDECRVQLLQHLAAKRRKGARRLRDAFSDQRKQARRSLKWCSALLEEEQLRGKRGSAIWLADATATALKLSAELSAWPRLESSNLHPFRLKVKELRYILQLADDRDSGFVDALGEVKDAIGTWHDWNELAAMTVKIIDHGRECTILKQVHFSARAMFDDALSKANAMRREYLDEKVSPRGKQKSRSGKLEEPIPITTARQQADGWSSSAARTVAS